MSARQERFVRAVGWASLGVAGAGVAAPRRLVSLAGLRPADDASLPVLVRFAAARQLSLGLALLSRRPVPVRRSARLFLPLTAIDAAAAVDGVRRGVLAPRAAVMAVAVLAANAAVLRSAERDASH